MSEFLRQVQPFRFNAESSKWQPVACEATTAEQPPTSCSSLAAPKEANSTIRLATLNILADCFPWFVEWATLSPMRFAALVKEIEKLDATILCLNEVTPTSLGVLMDAKFVRDNYYVSDIVKFRGTKSKTAAALLENRSIGSQHGCVMLSKIPFESLHIVQLPADSGEGLRPAIAATFRIPRLGVDTGATAAAAASASSPKTATAATTAAAVATSSTSFGVCALHTVAYQNKVNKGRRSKQIGRCVEAMKHLLGASAAAKRSVDCDDDSVAPDGGFCILGDLNLHFVNEDQTVLDHNLLDAWMETRMAASTVTDESPAARQKQKGYTFDPATNSMIGRYIPGEVRQMRLDRMLFSQGFPLLPKRPTTIWADAPVNKSKQIFLSDHYGLCQDLSLPTEAQRGWTRSDAAAELMQRNGALPDEKNIGTAGWYLRFGWAIGWHVPWLVGRGVRLW